MRELRSVGRGATWDMDLLSAPAEEGKINVYSDPGAAYIAACSLFFSSIGA